MAKMAVNLSPQEVKEGLWSVLLWYLSAYRARFIKPFRQFGRRTQLIPAKVIREFTWHLAVMVDAGFPVGQYLRALERTSRHSRFRSIIGMVAADVESGKLLSEAMRKHQCAFNDLYVNLVAAGEAGGILDRILDKLVIFLELDAAYRRARWQAYFTPWSFFSRRKHIALARFARTLSRLLSSGVPILDALDIVAKEGERSLREATEKIRYSVAEGTNMVGPMQDSGCFPSIFTMMIGGGEQTGSMDIVLEKLADFYEKEVGIK